MQTRRNRYNSQRWRLSGVLRGEVPADDRKGTPAEAVDYAKQRVISKSALYYMTVNGIDEIPCRFDVVSIEDDRIILYQNAFDYVEI